MTKKQVQTQFTGFISNDDGRVHMGIVQHTDELVAESDVAADEALRDLKTKLAEAKKARAEARTTFPMTVGGRAADLPITEAIDEMERLVIAIERDAIRAA